MLAISSLSQAASLDEQTMALLGMDLASLGDLKFYTASRSATDIDLAPSAVTVITADEIERRGYRTLHDALARVPGFFPAISGQAWELVSNRGFVQDQNINYLFLIDGHSQNTNTLHGMGHAHIYPTLDKVKRIEIIRGPGSTLWGSSANMGIIHIITKNGSDIDYQDQKHGALDATLDYDFEQQRQVASLQYGKVHDRGEVMVSLTGFKSDANHADIYKPTNNGIQFLNAALEPGWTSSSYSIWDHEPSHELYIKGSYDDFSFYLRDSAMQSAFPWYTPPEGDGSSFWTTKKRYADARYETEIGTDSELQVRLFYDEFTEIRDDDYSPVQAAKRGENQREFEYLENVIGTELIVQSVLGDHRLLFGLYADQRGLKKNVISDGVKVTSSNLFDVNEQNRALFVENTYSGLDDWVFTAGVRFDDNNLRDDTTATLPRFSAVHMLSDNITLKYAYNTGYVRPVMNRHGVDLKSQQSYSHDLQALFRTADWHGSITLYKSEVDDLIVFKGGNWINSSAIQMSGVELEGQYNLNDELALYGNYAYADSKFKEGKPWSDFTDPDGRVAGVPRHTMNIGADWDFSATSTLNLNLRGWSDAVTRWDWGVSEGFESFDTETYLDASVRTVDVAGIKDMTASLYIKNALDNDSPHPDGVEGGYVKNPHGRQIGFKIKYTF